jgi:hypothetical protein
MSNKRAFAVTCFAVVSLAVALIVYAKDIRAACHVSLIHLSSNKDEAFHSFNELWKLAVQAPLPASVDWGDVDISAYRVTACRKLNCRVFLVEAHPKSQSAIDFFMLEKAGDGSFRVYFRWGKCLG